MKWDFGNWFLVFSTKAVDTGGHLYISLEQVIKGLCITIISKYRIITLTNFVSIVVPEIFIRINEGCSEPSHSMAATNTSSSSSLRMVMAFLIISLLVQPNTATSTSTSLETKKLVPEAMEPNEAVMPNKLKVTPPSGPSHQGNEVNELE